MFLETERAYLAEMTRVDTSTTGRKPLGWIGPALTETGNTPSLLAELGYTYICDWCNDEQPYPLNVESHRMISVPYSVYLNDVTLMVGKNLSGEAFYQMIADQFEVLEHEGAEQGMVMAICLNPFVISHPFWYKHLDRALGFIANQKSAWITTSDEIAEWYLREHYDAAVASLSKNTTPNPLVD